MSKTKWITIRVDEEFYNRINRVIAHANQPVEGTSIKKIKKANWAIWALETKLIEEEQKILSKSKRKLASEKKAVGWG